MKDYILRNRVARRRSYFIDLKTKKELLMGTGFDNFTDDAHADFSELPDSILVNRNLLSSMMEKFGFKQLSTEWCIIIFPIHHHLSCLIFHLLNKKMNKKNSKKN
jgi:hypothetical protein